MIDSRSIPPDRVFDDRLHDMAAERAAGTGPFARRARDAERDFAGRSSAFDHDGDPRPRFGLPGIGSLRRLIELLPPEPPSFALAQALNQVLLPRLDLTTRSALALRAIELQFTDLGVRCRVALDADGIDGFSPALSSTPVAAHVGGHSTAFWALLRGHSRADTLIDAQVLHIDGNVNDALLVRRALDALGPPGLAALLPPSPRQMIDAGRSLLIVARALAPFGRRG